MSDATGQPVLPWRKVTPRDRRNDPRRWRLTLEQRGALEELLDAAWLDGGQLPVDDAVLATLSAAGPRWPEIGPPILAAFFRRDGDVYVCDELAAEAQAARDFIAKQKKNSDRGVKARRAKAAARASVAPVDEPTGQPTDEPSGQPIGQPPSAVSRQPSAVKKRKNGLAPSARADTWLTPYADAWKARWGAESEPPCDRMAKPMQAAEAKLGPEEALRRWKNYLASCTEVRFCTPQSFVQGLGQYRDATPTPTTDRGTANMQNALNWRKGGAA